MLLRFVNRRMRRSSVCTQPAEVSAVEKTASEEVKPGESITHIDELKCHTAIGHCDGCRLSAYMHRSLRHTVHSHSKAMQHDRRTAALPWKQPQASPMPPGDGRMSEEVKPSASVVNEQRCNPVSLQRPAVSCICAATTAISNHRG